MAEKPPEEGYISVVDEEPELYELLKWEPTNMQRQPEARPVEKAKSPDKSLSKPQELDPFELNEPTFIETYRLTKDLTRSLCEELKPVMPDSTKSIEFSVESKLIAALSFYATGKYQKSIGGKTDPSISQYFATTAVMQITEAFNHPTIVKKYIHFPHFKKERDFIKARFYMKYGMPDTIGCVECTHIPISRPGQDQKSHFNKSYHSKKVQIICDSDFTIISVDATPPGSLSHDAILNRHAVRVDLESLNNTGEQCWLVGGPHYTQKRYLMTPIPKITKKSPVSPEKYYTTVHSQTHSAVVNTIKQLKSRWKCLQASCNRQFDPDNVKMLIVACCVLHNICNARGLPVVAMAPAEERIEAMKQKVANGSVPRKPVEDQNGIQVRTLLVERLWNERRVMPESGSGPKKRVSKKDKVQENHQIQSQPVQQPNHQIHHNVQQNHQNHQMHHEDLSKRPRIISMTTPTYALNVPPVWGHYPQH